MAQKIKAVLARKRAMGRDLYDIVYLYSLTRPNMEYLEQKLSLAEPEEVKRAMKKKLGSYKKDRLVEDIKPFVSDESKLGAVRKFDKWLES